MAFAVKNLVTKAFVMKFVELVGRAFSAQVISAKFLSGALFAFALNKLGDSKALKECIVTFPTTCQDARIQDSFPHLHLGNSVVHKSQFLLHAA